MSHDPRALLRRYGLRPRRSLGQNFLVDPVAPARIAALAELQGEERVLEVGAGLGTLTRALAERAGEVIAVETDPHLLPVLEAETADLPNVRLVHGDILALAPASLLGLELPARALNGWPPREKGYRVVANLPYYITAAVLRHLLEASPRPERLVVTVQREVAQRMVAERRRSLLAVSVQFYGRPRLAMRLKRGAFYPPPAVESAVVVIESHDAPPVSVPDVAAFFRVVRAGFAQKRKQLRNALAAGLHLPPALAEELLRRAEVSPKARAEQLDLEAWGRLARAWAEESGVAASRGGRVNRAEEGGE